MVPHTTCLRLPPGRALVRAGEVARELIVILSGEAMTEGPGDRLVVLGPGTEIGGREALRHERHATTVVAATPLDVVVVTGPSLRWAHAAGVARLAPATTLAPVIPMPRSTGGPSLPRRTGGRGDAIRSELVLCTGSVGGKRHSKYTERISAVVGVFAATRVTGPLNPLAVGRGGAAACADVADAA